MEKYFDPFLTQNRTGTGSYGRKQRNACPANIGKQLETEPKRLRFFFGTTYGPEGRGFESLTACQKDPKPYGFGSFCLHKLLFSPAAFSDPNADPNGSG